MRELQSLIYVSTATRRPTAEDVAAIAQESEAMNRRNNVSGALLLSEGNFMQSIEGDVAGIASTYARIQGSTKHHRLIELRRVAVARRQFSGREWAFQLQCERQFSTPLLARFLESPVQSQPDLPTSVEQKISREFWDGSTRPGCLWYQG